MGRPPISTSLHAKGELESDLVNESAGGKRLGDGVGQPMAMAAAAATLSYVLSGNILKSVGDGSAGDTSTLGVLSVVAQKKK